MLSGFMKNECCYSYVIFSVECVSCYFMSIDCLSCAEFSREFSRMDQMIHELQSVIEQLSLKVKEPHLHLMHAQYGSI